MSLGSMARASAFACALMAIAGADRACADDSIKALAKAYNGFGQDLFTVLEHKPGNIVFSPYSVGVAMAMTMSGARGDTQSEMLSAMRFTQTPSEIEGANGPLAAELHSYARQLPAQPSPKEICAKMRRSDAECIKRVTAAWKPPAAPTRLEIANALMVRRLGDVIGNVSTSYASLLREKFGAELFQNVSLEAINTWASRKTKGKIPALLDKLPSDAIAVILDAVYFHGAWQAPFESKRTRNAPFTLGSGEIVQTATMEVDRGFALYEGQGFKALRLPYQTPELGMVIVVPSDPKRLSQVSASLDAAGQAKLLQELDRAPSQLLDLKLPRFKLQYKASLKEPMKLAGLKLAFDNGQANFDGIAGKPLRPGTLFIDDVIHAATIEVAEEGTEASAATAVEIVLTAVAVEPKPFAVDRPFLFYIVDQASGAVLFQGRIEDPRPAPG